MFVLQAALDDLISPNVLEGEGCAGSAGGGGQMPQPWKEGDGVEARGLHKPREVVGTRGTCCCAAGDEKYRWKEYDLRCLESIKLCLSFLLL